MPTALPRFQVTQTEEVARALEAAERAWPELTRAEWVKQLLTRGAETLSAVEDERTVRRRRRLEAIKRTSGALTGVYEPGYLEKLREEWPG